jgi:hypothetical protein
MSVRQVRNVGLAARAVAAEAIKFRRVLMRAHYHHVWLDVKIAMTASLGTHAPAHM